VTLFGQKDETNIVRLDDSTGGGACAKIGTIKETEDECRS